MRQVTDMAADSGRSGPFAARGWQKCNTRSDFHFALAASILISGFRRRKNFRMSQTDNVIPEFRPTYNFRISEVIGRTFWLLSRRPGHYLVALGLLIAGFLLIDFFAIRLVVVPRDYQAWAVFILRIIVISTVYVPIEGAVMTSTFNIYNNVEPNIFKNLYATCARFGGATIVCLPMSAYQYGISFQSHVNLTNFWFSWNTIAALIVLIVLVAAPTLFFLRRETAFVALTKSRQLAKRNYFKIFVAIAATGFILVCLESLINNVIMETLAYVRNYNSNYAISSRAIDDELGSLSSQITLIIRAVLWTSIYIELSKKWQEHEMHSMVEAFD
jgi:hypothetical protein